MIKNFDEIHKQLQDLAPVINSFKSEAVQLRIVELVFRGVSDQSDELNPNDPVDGEEKPVPKKRARKRTSAKKSATSESGSESPKKKARKSTSGRPGPGAMIDTLIGEGYFQDARGPADLVAHCKNNKVFTYTNTEMSVSLARAVKSGKLKREQNSDGQFQYSAV